MTRHRLRALAVLLLLGCSQSPESKDSPPAPAGAKPRLVVIASVYPLYEFARHVAGDRADVTSLVPPGVEPHDWEPAAQDVARLERAHMFIYNGAGFEPWADKLLGNLGRAGPTVVVATEGIELLRTDLPGQSAPDEHDPHVWLDPVLAEHQVEILRAALARADPAGAEIYATNAQAFSERLRALGEQYQRGLSQCTRREIVVSHASFGYTARRYRLIQVPITGLAPDSEPSPAHLAGIVRFARRHGVRFIFFETLVSPRLAETLAREVGARTLVLNPVEGLTEPDREAARGYVELMEDNLKNLRTALECA